MATIHNADVNTIYGQPSNRYLTVVAVGRILPTLLPNVNINANVLLAQCKLF